jgi:hypothetical protein
MLWIAPTENDSATNTLEKRLWDPFSQADLKYMAEKGLRFDRSITNFACMSRPQGTIRQSPIDWNVRPPRDAFA